MVVSKQTSGIKISAPGFDANICPDYDLLFNSSWVSLQLLKELTQTVVATFDGTFWNFPTVTLTHNLGFYAFADVWETNNSNDVGLIKTMRMNSKLSIGNNSVIWTGDTFITGQPNNITINIKVYNLDISQQMAYNYIQPPVIQNKYDPSFGMKITKYGKSTSSNDMRDYILHTRAQSPAILAILTQDNVDSNGLISFTNQQNYTNWVYGYYKNSHTNYYQLIPQQSQAYPSYNFTNGNTYTAAYLGGGDKISLVVFRDPLLVPKQVQATY